MIKSVVIPRPLECHDVSRVLDDADGLAVPRARSAHRADFPVGEILAYFAGVDFFVSLHNGVGKLFGLALGKAEHKEGQPLSRLFADAGQTGKLVHKLLQRSHVIGSHA